jgi:hypothetical protein
MLKKRQQAAQQAEIGRHEARTNPLLPNLVALPSYSVAPIMA